jgi:hypothetical protein
MRFTVLWVPGAEQRLAELWLSSSERDAVTAASHIIDQNLQLDPLSQGESRPGGRRILFEAPLGVIYRVEEQDSIVRVLHVWLFE